MSVPRWWKIEDQSEYETLFNHLFTYDVSSPSFLRWKNPRKQGMKPGDVAGNYKNNDCFQVCYDGEKYKVHHVIWIMHGNTIPRPYFVRHRDEDTTNNKLENLYLVSTADLNLRRQGFGTSSTRGIHFDKSRNKWCAEYYLNRKKIFIGRFATEQEALLALNAKLAKLPRHRAF